jgi:hypothetical protein
VRDFFTAYASGQIDGHHFGALEFPILEKIDRLRDRKVLIDAMVTSADVEAKVDMTTHDKKPFPIVLVCEPNIKLRLRKTRSPFFLEFDLIEPLIMGEDIRMIATDTQKNRRSLLTFFAEHGWNIEVVLFSQLKRGIEKKQPPLGNDELTVAEQLEETRLAMQMGGALRKYLNGGWKFCGFDTRVNREAAALAYDQLTGHTATLATINEQLAEVCNKPATCSTGHFSTEVGPVVEKVRRFYRR